MIDIYLLLVILLIVSAALATAIACLVFFAHTYGWVSVILTLFKWAAYLAIFVFLWDDTVPITARAVVGAGLLVYCGLDKLHKAIIAKSLVNRG